MRPLKKPSRFLYYFAALFVVPYLKIKFNIHSQKRPKIDGPFVVLGNHQAFFDPFFLSYALYGYRLNFVAGYELMLNPKTRWIVRFFHIIPKFQYQIDLMAIKQMMQVVKSGGNLALFPTGRLSSCGQGFDASMALVKLLKKLNVPVYFCQIEGAYFSNPKWGRKTRRGRVDVSYFPLLSTSDLKQMEEEAMLQLLNRHLNFNEYEAQIKRMIPYHGKYRAEHLENILYRCPKCEQEFHTTTKEDRIICQHCHFELSLDEYGYFTSNPYFKSPLEWFHYQEKSVYDLLQKNQLSLQSNVVVKSSNGHRIVVMGLGRITLVNHTIHFQGQMNNQTVDLIIPLVDLPSLPYKAGVNFEVPYQDKIFVFELENGKEAVKWSIAAEQLYKQPSKE